MALPNIQLGRVESDPMGIPIAASMQKGDNTFDRLLQDSVANDETPLDAEPQARTEQSEIESELGNDNDTPEPRKSDDTVDAEQPRDVVTDETEDATVDLDDDVTESIQRGEPEQQAKSAGKGTDSPRTSTPTSEPLLAAALNNQNAGQATNQLAAQTQAQTNNQTRTVEPTMRGSVNGTTTNKTAPKAANVQGAYSARSAAQAQMLEQARDSVFKQIMMKMNKEGGEVRMRLEPPELGQLDLRMTVESGNKLSLALSADRSDINQLLHRHLEELKQTLQANGLEIADAEVQTRSEFESQQAQSDAQEGAVAPGESGEETDSAPQPRGFVTAEGLDFLA